jgi:hypothetical protein
MHWGSLLNISNLSGFGGPLKSIKDALLEYFSRIGTLVLAVIGLSILFGSFLSIWNLDFEENSFFATMW